MMAVAVRQWQQHGLDTMRSVFMDVPQDAPYSEGEEEEEEYEAACFDTMEVVQSVNEWDVWDRTRNEILEEHEAFKTRMEQERQAMVPVMYAVTPVPIPLDAPIPIAPVGSVAPGCDVHPPSSVVCAMDDSSVRSLYDEIGQLLDTCFYTQEHVTSIVNTAKPITQTRYIGKLSGKAALKNAQTLSYVLGDIRNHIAALSDEHVVFAGLCTLHMLSRACLSHKTVRGISLDMGYSIVPGQPIMFPHYDQKHRLGWKKGRRDCWRLQGDQLIETTFDTMPELCYHGIYHCARNELAVCANLFLNCFSHYVPAQLLGRHFAVSLKEVWHLEDTKNPFFLDKWNLSNCEKGKWAAKSFANALLYFMNVYHVDE